jgi:hypothetical protein
MSEVQVSNARRIGFTALALVAFWVMAWRAYSIAFGINYGSEFSDTVVSTVAPLGIEYGGWLVLLVLDHQYLIAGLSLAPVPTLLLWIASGRTGNRRWLLICGLLFASAISFAFWRTEADSNWAPDGDQAKQRREHEVSWFSLLLPIILTTAFVIFGAWRGAVRDAEVEAVGEGG